MDTFELQRALGLPAVLRLYEGALGRRAAEEALRTGRARVNEGAIWRLLADKLYGSHVDAPVVATREALQNSRDAIDAAFRKGLVDREGGRFEVELDRDEPRSLRWTDNGIGMDSDTVFNKFLSLGDTTKLAGGGEAGGFGIAKAIILGISTTFRWRMHTRDSLYVAEGFQQDVVEYRAPYLHQGVKLTIYDLDPKWAEWDGEGLHQRLKASLALNQLNPRGRHAGIRLYLEAREVVPFLRARPRHLVKAWTVDASTTLDVRAYPKTTSNEWRVVRLDGLYQYHRASWYDELGVDLAFDFKTDLPPSASNYPLTASRTQLSGEAAGAYAEVVRQIQANRASATREPATKESLGFNQAEALEVERGLKAAMDRLQALLDDPHFASRLQATRGAGDVYRTMQQELHRTHHKWEVAREERLAAEEAARKHRSDEAAEFWKGSSQEPAASHEPPPPPRDLQVGALRHVKEKPPPRPRVNPWAGIAVVDIDKAQWNASRLRRYFGNPDRWIPHALAWKLTCQMVLEEIGHQRIDYNIGFLFDDKAHAAYTFDGDRGERHLLINLEWLVSMVKAYQAQPLAVAAVLHGKACHEIAHLVEGGDDGHGQRFSQMREEIQDETVGVLYPLAAAIRHLLRLRGAVPAGGKGQRVLRPEDPRTWCRNCRGRQAS